MLSPAGLNRGFLDLRRIAEGEREAVTEAVMRVLASGRLVLGPELEAFEEEFARFTGQRHCVAVSSGASALALALTAVGVRPGDEVLVPAFTAVPSAAAVCSIGAVPVFVDVRPGTGTMDPAAAAEARRSRTRAVMPVHLYGRPSEVPDLGIPVVEDAAHAHGAVDGSRSAAVAYSFYPTKNLGGVGDGGAVVTDDGALAAEIRLLRSHGIGRDQRAVRVAMNARMSEIEAAVLRHRLQRVRAGNARRQAIAGRYREAAPGLRWQAPHPDHVYHLCVARHPDRDAFRAALGAPSAVHYRLAVPDHPAYRRFLRHACPEARAWAAECVSLPCHPAMTDDEVDAVAGALAAVEVR